MKPLALILTVFILFGTASEPPNRIQSVTPIIDQEGMPTVYLVRLSSLTEGDWEGYRSNGIFEVREYPLMDAIAVVSVLSQDSIFNIINERL